MKIWRAFRWFARWMPLALLACFAGAATLYCERYSRDIALADAWAFFFMGVSGLAGVAAVRRARGLPLWDLAPQGRERLFLAQVGAAFAGLLVLLMAVLALTIVHRGEIWLPWLPIFALEILPRMALLSGLALMLIAASLTASAYLSRAAADRGLLLLILGVGLGVLYGPMLRWYVRLPANWPHADEVIGALMGLVLASTFWTMGGAAVVAESAPGTAPTSYRKMSSAAWAGFRRAIGKVVAVTTGILLFLPTPLYCATPAMMIASGEGVLGEVIVAILAVLFVISFLVARAAKRAFRYAERGAYLHGERVGVCALVLFATLGSGLIGWGLSSHFTHL